MTDFTLQASSSPVDGNKGLFNIVPWYVSVLIITVVIIGGAIISRRVKNSGSLDDNVAQMVLADTYGVLPDVGSRREKALDIGVSQDEMTSGEVSKEEIAAALAKSMADQFTPPPTVNLPPPGMPPAGLPPIGMPPKAQIPPGMPPVIPKPTTQAPAPPTSNAQNGPPLPPTGLPAGWTMEQWNAYGHMWLEKNRS